jgi:hypothetical protein
MQDNNITQRLPIFIDKIREKFEANIDKLISDI